jgi:murein DD-endopeptidase MepM/ murein hydrolase activator NlpD
LGYLRRSILKTILLVLNFTSFLLFVLVYLTKKVRFLFTFSTRKKDQLVKTLMWRRGVLFRPATHGGVVALAIVAVIFGSVFGGSGVEAQNLEVDQDAVLSSQTSSETVLPENRPRTEILTYEVKGGDTVSTIAQSFGVSNETVMWANGIVDAGDIKPAQSLKIPPVTGVLHTVKSGESLDAVAKKYKADTQTVADFPGNFIDDSFAIKAGSTLIIPNGEIVPEAPARTAVAARPTAPRTQGSSRGSGLLRWPVGGGISQYSSFFHPGAVDIMNDVGTGVVAADSGRVITSQRLGYGYGWHIVIDHGNGYTTLYGHMSALYVTVGQTVSKGQTIGAIGLTGRTTGPHLHFETRRNGSPVNPMSLLP